MATVAVCSAEIQPSHLNSSPSTPKLIKCAMMLLTQISNELIQEYPTVFDSLGKLDDYAVHVHVDPAMQPVVQPPTRDPFHLRQNVDDKLQELLDKDIIEPVSGPIMWASPLVVIPKANGELRVCVYMRHANEGVIRERHPIPTLEETLQALNGASVFSKVDLRWEYHQVELDLKSRDITTLRESERANAIQKTHLQSVIGNGNACFGKTVSPSSDS